MLLRKSTRRPLASVRWPSSNIWSSILKTSGWAFSTSSRSIKQYDLRLTASVNWPPSSKPTYPGGAPTSLETANFSINSDMSSLIRDSSLPNIYSARALASSVLPTPVGPRKIKLPMGCLGSFRPARARLTALAIILIASSWPIIRSCSTFSMLSSRLVSSLAICTTGMPVHMLTTSAMSSAVTSGFSCSCSACHSSSSFFLSSSALSSCCLSSAAWSYCWVARAASLSLR